MLSKNSYRFIIASLFGLIFIISVYYADLISVNSIKLSEFTRCISPPTSSSSNYSSPLKDFNRYNCSDRKRIGGKPEYTSKTKDPLWRIDGAWFFCFDSRLKPVKNNCNILSFGINNDDTFDSEMNLNYGCVVHSFDPYVEHSRFKTIRDSKIELKDSFKIKANEKWFFYRLGIVGSVKNIQTPTKIGGMNTLENILEMTGLRYKVIDMFKMDIERGEVDVLENFDIDYACKYYKQFALETHPESNLDTYMYRLLTKLDKCFLLFHRQTRFYRGDTWAETGHKTEYQNPNGWSFNIKDYKDEITLATFILSMGELYFVNKNYI